MLNARRSSKVFWNIFLKFSGKYQWCSPNISKLFNRPPENRFNNRQYATHKEQLIDALSRFMCLYFLHQNGFFTISGTLQNFWQHKTTVSLCRDHSRLFWNSTTLDDLSELVKGQKFWRFSRKKGISNKQAFLTTPV